LTLRAVGVALRQFGLKDFVEDLVPVLPQKYEQLRTPNPCHDLLLGRRTRDWRLPQLGTHELPPLHWNARSKPHAALIVNYAPDDYLTDVLGIRDQGSGAGAQGLLTIVSVAITLVVLVSGLVFFRATERTFADVI